MAIQTFKVGAGNSGRSLAHYLSDCLRLTHHAVVRLVRANHVRLDGVPQCNPDQCVQCGQQVAVQTGSDDRSANSRDDAAKPAIVHADSHIVVVDKPPGLTSMRHAHEAAEFGKRGQRYLPPTLLDMLPQLIPGAGKGRISAVHRLDNETSGLIVFALTPEAESSLGRQFRGHTTERLYRALVRGRPPEGRMASWLVRDRGDGRRGSGVEGPEAQRAVTHVRILERLGEFSLVECRLETGRTHQVRIHLGEAGAPLCGDHVYDRPLNGRPVPDDSGAKRILLHAATLGFDHPATGERVRWEAPLPKDMAMVLRALRKRNRPAS